MIGSLIVGIDPGQETGLAVYDPATGVLQECGSYGFWDVVRRFRRDLLPPCDAGSVGLVVVEDTRALPIYERRNGIRGRQRDAMCRSVGRIDREIELWESWLRGRGYRVQMVQPVKAKKWDAAFFERVTGWKGRTNQHARDAARLVWGRTVPKTLFDAEVA